MAFAGCMIALVNQPGGYAMKRIAAGFGLLVIVISTSSMNANAEDCPSGHYYRMSGRCADASGRKVYGAPMAHHPVKQTPHKKPQGY